jgi:hypothetical protein
MFIQPDPRNPPTREVACIASTPAPPIAPIPGARVAGESAIAAPDRRDQPCPQPMESFRFQQHRERERVRAVKEWFLERDPELRFGGLGG